MPEPKDIVVGVDFGGTKILAGVFDGDLECIGKTKISTKSGRGQDVVIQRIARCVKDAVDECDLSLKQIKGIGIGAPAAVDPKEGKVLMAPNLGWEDVPLRKELEKELGIPVFLENDANVCILGIHEVEFKGEPDTMVGIFLGTGIGGGLILNHKLYSGFNQTAGEIGHMILDIDGPKCNCGNRGCFEALASRTALFKRIESAVKDGEKTILTEMLGSDLANLRSGDLRKAIRRGDKLVEKIVEEAAEYTGIAVANVINLLNPEIIVLGGGVIDALEDEMMAIIVETAKEVAIPGTAKGIQIVSSKLGDNAGSTGAAVLARQRLAAKDRSSNS
jgi:glucokinase